MQGEVLLRSPKGLSGFGLESRRVDLGQIQSFAPQCNGGQQSQAVENIDERTVQVSN